MDNEKWLGILALAGVGLYLWSRSSSSSATPTQPTPGAALVAPTSGPGVTSGEFGDTPGGGSGFVRQPFPRMFTQ